MSDKHEPETCPYCAALLLIGEGIRTTANKLYKDRENKHSAIIKVAAFVTKPVELLDKACKERQEQLSKKEPKMLN